MLTKEQKNTKGITLIALIVTILIILIIAGVTISTLTNKNGIIKSAIKVKNSYINAEGLENIQLAVLASLNRNGDIDTISLAKNLSLIDGLTDEENQAISENSEITLPKSVKFNNISYRINSEGEVYRYYNENGLIVLLDGINNTRNGHSTTTTTWEDLSGNNNDFTQLSGASNAIWSDNSFVGDATNRTLVLNKAILEDLSECSVEVCYDIPQLANYYWVFQSRQTHQPPNGFQFVASSSTRGVTLFVNNSNYNNITRAKGDVITDIGKRTMAFALDSSNITFSDNGQLYSEEIKEGLVPSIVQRDYYSIGSCYPWEIYSLRSFKGNIYSIRVYNRKLSAEELKNNYEVDRIRFNMD